MTVESTSKHTASALARALMATSTSCPSKEENFRLGKLEDTKLPPPSSPLLLQVAEEELNILIEEGQEGILEREGGFIPNGERFVGTQLLLGVLGTNVKQEEWALGIV
mmetsp:Transcript_13828/g.19791  ORF Transcript_13828/g.19791 Transcript_13828/m.19791 type:complete len:108 (+) Transcript_13828:731-1054(+)